MIRLGIMAFNPLFTRNNTSFVTKESGVQIALNYRERFFSKANERVLISRVKIINPLIKQFNIDKLVAPGCNLGLRQLA